MATLKPRVCALATPRWMHSWARFSVSAIVREPAPRLCPLRSGLHSSPHGCRARASHTRPSAIVHPPVPGAGQAHARELALAERAALVGAHVVARVDLVLDAYEDEARAAHLHQLGLAGPEVVQASHVDQAHRLASPAAPPVPLPSSAHVASLRT